MLCSASSSFSKLNLFLGIWSTHTHSLCLFFFTYFTFFPQRFQSFSQHQYACVHRLVSLFVWACVVKIYIVCFLFRRKSRKTQNVSHHSFNTTPSLSFLATFFFFSFLYIPFLCILKFNSAVTQTYISWSNSTKPYITYIHNSLTWHEKNPQKFWPFHISHILSPLTN